MTTGELKEFLKDYPDNYEIYVYDTNGNMLDIDNITPGFNDEDKDTIFIYL